MKTFPWIGPKSPCFIESGVSTKIAKSVSENKNHRFSMSTPHGDWKGARQSKR